MTWVKADEPFPELPPPTKYGWTLESGILVSVRSSGLPAPLPVPMLIKCSCKASSCASSKYSCIHANIKCTELCGCSDDCHYDSDTISLASIESIWAAAWDFQKFDILTSVDSGKPLQPSFKLRNSRWCSVSNLTIIEYSSDWQRLWSDCAYAQADLRLCWSHIPHCWKSHAAAHLRKWLR